MSKRFLNNYIVGEAMAEVIDKKEKFLLRILSESEVKVEEHETEWRSLREGLLGAKSGDIKAVEYTSRLEGSIDKSLLDLTLNELGNERYKDKIGKAPFMVWPYDFWNSFTLELRWPFHYAAWIDSIKVSSGGEVSIRFMRSKSYLSEHLGDLEKDANQVYDKIGSMLKSKASKQP